MTNATRRARAGGWLRLALPGALLLQLTACFGSDPQFYFTNLITSTVVSNLISALFSALLTPGTTT